MALNAILAYHNITAVDIFTAATVDLDMQVSITGIHLGLQASAIEDVDEATFAEIAEGAKAHCIISKALNMPITLSVAYA